jgi:argininosuccinate lyase
VNGLAKAGIISNEEAQILVTALTHVKKELVEGAFTFLPSDEDIHTAIERRVTEIAGEIGAKLHTGRSRNDQVTTATRLLLRHDLVEIGIKIVGLCRALLDQSTRLHEAYMPGYTHMQRAQPVPIAHHLLAHAWALDRDLDRIVSTLHRMNVSPLGAGALAGSSLPLDPEYVASELGFSSSFDNSMDAVSDRDYVAEALFDLALLGVHLSRIGEEIVIWSTQEFGFITIADAYATGSSMLPQKKNPDIAELTRGKSGRLLGNLAGFLATLKGLPLAYNRDLQEDKEPLFDSLDQVSLALEAMTGLVSTLSFNTSTTKQAADGEEGVAVDLAEWLVAKGMPFRQAHGLIASLVKNASERHLTLAELVRIHPDLGEEAISLMEPGVSLARRVTHGGASEVSVKEQTGKLSSRLTERLEQLNGFGMHKRGETSF